MLYLENNILFKLLHKQSCKVSLSFTSCLRNIFQPLSKLSTLTVRDNEQVEIMPKCVIYEETHFRFYDWNVFSSYYFIFMFKFPEHSIEIDKKNVDKFQSKLLNLIAWMKMQW